MRVHGKSAEHFIGFDGERWLFGHCGLPNSYLDATKYPEDIHSYELASNGGRGRPLYWMHGYISQDASLPEHIPQLAPSTLEKLHETHILPHWVETDYGKARAVIRSQYEPIQEISHTKLDTYLPPDAVASLKKAHAEGKPIMFAYDAATRNVTDLTESYARELGARQPKTHTPPHQSTASTSPPRSGGSSYASSTTSETRDAGSFFKEALNFRHANGGIRWGKVTGVAVGASVIGGIAYLLYTHKKDEKKTEPWAVRVAKSNPNNMISR